MPLLPFSSDYPFIWYEEPSLRDPEEILVLGVMAGPAEDTLPAEPPAAAIVAEPPAIPAEPVVPATVDPPAEPTLVLPEPTATPAPVAVSTPATLPEAAPATVDPPTADPAFTVPDEASFPTLAELEAILAANAGAPAGPTAAERAELAALLGLDPAIADDPALFAETLANLPDPDADAALEQWLAEYGVEGLPPDVTVPAGTWQLG